MDNGVNIKNALILSVESNINKGGGGGYDGGGCRKNLEEEAIKCVKSWRKYGGNLKDIDIIAMCCTNNPPSQNTIKALQELGVNYIHKYYPITDGFPAGWWSVPLVGKIVENMMDYDFLIHIDLDITLIRELDERIFWHSSISDFAKCAVYSKEFPDDEKYIKCVEKTFVTCIISSWTSNMFYTKWFDTMMDIWSKWILEEDTWWNYCNIEEHAVDYIYHKYNMHIVPIKKSQIGNDQGYDTLDSFTDDELDKIYFLHNHFDNPDGANRTIMDYFKRVKNAKKV